MHRSRSHAGILFVASLLLSTSSVAAQIRIAVASNFADTMTSLATQFERTSGHTVVLSFGSTGKHYAQITNGAPFDAFFAADARRPRLLENQGLAVTGSRITYAVGKLVLWSPRAGFVDPQGKALQREFRFLALANPKLAPYGLAAKQVLQARGLWDSVGARLVRGENIGQTFQFVASGNAEMGFVAYSQIRRPGHDTPGSFWQVPQSLYSRIEQQAVLLRDNPATRAFLGFVRSTEALKIIHDYGYDTH